MLAHGLCLNDLQWNRRGHDHGAALARDLGYTPVYLHYNTGLHISTNGRQLAEALEALVAQWPVPLEEFALVAHSMGGLVARSACHYGALAAHAWPRRLGTLVFLGTPHHGAPMERGGNWIDTLLEISPYTAPFARLGKIRSAGITDLRYGNLADEDWHGRDRFARGDRRRFVPLPDGVRCFAIGATAAAKPRARASRAARRRARPARERARPARQSGPRSRHSEVAAVDRPRLRAPRSARPARGIPADPAVARRRLNARRARGVAAVR